MCIIDKGHLVWCDDGVRLLPVPNKTAAEIMLKRLSDFHKVGDGYEQEEFNQKLCDFKSMPNYPHEWGLQLTNVLNKLECVQATQQSLAGGKGIVILVELPESFELVYDAIILSATTLKIADLLGGYHRPRRAVGYWEED